MFNSMTKFFSDKKKQLLIGKGYALEDIRKRKFIKIAQNESSRKGHTFVFGTTRVGKTRLAQNCITQDILDGKNIVVIDPKVDNELFSDIYATAKKAGREQQLMLLTTIYPEYSAKLNALANFFIPDEVIQNVMAGVPADDEFFWNYAYEIVSVIVRSLLLLKKKKEITFHEISLYVSYLKIQELIEKISARFDTQEAEKIVVLEKAL